MSFAKSPVLAPTELSDALQTALIAVSENAYFVFVEPCEPGQFDELARNGGTPLRPWLRATVDFSGESAGSVEILLPEKLGSWLVTSLLGMESEEALASPQLYDGVAEFTNMVCGAWLSTLSEETLFTLKSPRVVAMPPEWTPLEPSQEADAGWRQVSLNEMPMQIRALW
jgi:hypothetical protein